MILIIIVEHFYSQNYRVSKSVLNIALHCLHLPYKNNPTRITMRLSLSKNIINYKYRIKGELLPFKHQKNTFYLKRNNNYKYLKCQKNRKKKIKI
jgi:hypothetical protein